MARPEAEAVAEGVAPHSRGDGAASASPAAVGGGDGLAHRRRSGHGVLAGGRDEGHDEALAFDDSSFGDGDREGDSVVHGVEGVAGLEGGGGDDLDVGGGWGRRGGGSGGRRGDGAVAAGGGFFGCHGGCVRSSTFRWVRWDVPLGCWFRWAWSLWFQ
mmetsp:Transcript_24961/g.51509  ORF Transcript_24961/g.51509 Transcript_24961/m.51509 type:complete len:158 (+) Transcript_24961:914-1387(+)